MKSRCLMLSALPLTLLLTVGCQSTGSLGGTSWTALEVLSLDETDIVDLDVDFGKDGIVTSNVTHANGTKEESRRQYTVHKSLLSVTRPELGDLDLLYRIEGDEMILTAENFQARLLRLSEPTNHSE